MPEVISVSVQPQEVIFKWNKVDFNCPSMTYNFSTSNCGRCFLTNLTAVTCTNFNLLPSNNNQGPMCMFSVHSVICGNISGRRNTASVALQGSYLTIILLAIKCFDTNC